jgi:hypothetical protein
MGIKYAHRYTYSIKNLSIDSIYSIASERLKKMMVYVIDPILPLMLIQVGSFVDSVVVM